MTFSPELAEIRFGYGLSPLRAAVGSIEAMLQGLTGSDQMAETLPIPSFEDRLPHLLAFNQARRRRKQVAGTSESDAADATFKEMRKQSRALRSQWYGLTVQRCCATRTGFRERLAQFWADHFTAQGKSGILTDLASSYVESAIRPHLAGRFADLVFATATSPLMLHFLDQVTSTGPNSPLAGSRPNLTGLNENLAREVLELHTLGVSGPYGQEDVRQLAELFTGLTYNPAKGFFYRAGQAEPGAEVVLGKAYDGGLEAIRAALEDLSTHPATAHHIARKLVVHFVRDDPEPHHVAYVANRFLDTGGDLMAVYSALLDHPEAWISPLFNVKPPFDFVVSACRALGVGTDPARPFRPQDINRVLLRPLALMGQRWQAPNGPDGWPEDDAAWITPQGLAARMRWAMVAPARLRPDLPPPTQFLDTALGPMADERLRFAATAAETGTEAIGLILSSPRFQRR